VGAVVDSLANREAVQRAGPLGFLMEQVSLAPNTAGMLREAKLASGPYLVKDWSYVCQHLVGDVYVLVGDAACFVDPLFSSGVHLALMSGVLAAAYVTSALKDPDLGRAAILFRTNQWFITVIMGSQVPKLTPKLIMKKVE